jgi:hypothetical protein
LEDFSVEKMPTCEELERNGKGVGNEVNQARQGEKTLKESEHNFKAFAENANDEY